ncbi:glycosyltransferase [filamentous cyanobacterium CCP5]|nr:glycosyltransferase [filamentous cyanobacterium CCP5]
MRVLALVPGGIDDQVLFLPTLQHLHKELPKAEIFVVTTPEAKSFYGLTQLVAGAIPYGFGLASSPADWANLLGIIREYEFEAVITLTQSWSIGLMLWLSGIPTRIGYASGSNSLYLTRTVPLKPDQPLMDQYHDLLGGLNITGPCPDTLLNIPQKDLTWADSLRQNIGLGEQGYVLVYPGPESATGQSYPADQWATILKDFNSRQPDLPLALIQTTDNAAIATATVQMVPGVKLLGPETLSQTAALIAGANLLLSTDSYPLYLAIALQVFALGLFGQNAPTRQLPAAEGEVRVMGIAADSGQLADIDPQTVLKKVWGE